MNPFDNWKFAEIPKSLLRESLIDNKEAAIFVRGDNKYEYHDDNLRAFKDELKNAGFSQVKKKQGKISSTLNGVKVEFKCLGGGRIQHKYNGTVCSIYGYSQSYGHVDHTIAQKIISQDLGYPTQEILLNQKEY